MRWQWVGLASAMLLVATQGCSADSAEDGGPSGAGGWGVGAAGSGPTASSAGPSTGVGAAPGDGNDTFDSAQPIELGVVVPAEISPAGDVDYYAFTAQAGDIIHLDIDAQDLDGSGFDAKHLDLVLTVYAIDETQLAENDTPVPRYSADPETYFVVPASGEYVLRVAECWQYASDPEAQCAAPASKSFTSYELAVSLVDPAQRDAVVGELEPNDDGATATPVDYAKADGGAYFYSDIVADFGAPADVDVYAFSLPVDTPVAQGRPIANFWPMAWGPSGNGSTTTPGVMYLVDPLVPGLRVAEVDTALGQRLQVPVDLGRAYELWVAHQGSRIGPNDFYVTRHYGTGSNPAEQMDAYNAEWSGAETLGIVDNTDGTFSFFVDGDIGGAGVDVDYFAIDAAPTAELTKVSAACSAERRGSGLRGLTFELLDAQGATLPGASASEGPDQDASLADIAIPGGARTLGLRVSAESQAANVTSTFYRCGVHLGK